MHRTFSNIQRLTFGIALLFATVHTDTHGQFTQIPNLYGESVLSLVKIGNSFFAGGYGGIFRSTDGGATWHSASAGITNLNVIALIAVGTRLYASTNGGGSYYSDNEGTGWTKITVPLDKTFSGLCSSGAGIFALGNNGDLFKIDPVTATATMLNVSLVNVRSIAASSTKIFAGTQDGFFESADGSNWTTVTNWGANGGVYDVAASGNYIIALPLSGLRQFSEDNGVHWTSVSVNPLSPVNIAVIDNTIYIGSNYAAFKTTVGSVDPFVEVDGLPAIGGIVNNSTAVVAGSEEGIYRSIDGGATWEISNTGLTSAPIFALATEGNNLYTAVSRRVMRLNGTTWTNLMAPGTYGFPILALFARENILLAGTYGTGLFVSTDKGETWSTATGIVGATCFTSIGTKVYAGNFQGVFESSDGITWTQLIFGRPSITSIGAVGQDLYYSNFQGTSRFTDGNSIDVSAGLPAGSYASSFTGVGERVFCALTNYGIYTSINKGATWTKLSVNGTVESLQVHNGIVYGTQLEQGILVSMDNGATWSAYNTGLSSGMYNGFNGISRLAFANSKVYAGGRMTGVWQNCAIIPKPIITGTGIGTLTPQLSSNVATGNQWYLNGTAIPSATGQTISPTASGIYTAIVSENGCSSQPSSGFDFVVLGVKEPQSEVSLYVYPSPARGSASVGFHGLHPSESRDVTLYNIQGQRVFGGSVHGDETLAIENCSPGVYIVRSVHEGRPMTARLLIY